MLTRLGVSRADARATATVLVRADMRGASAHGVARLASDYIPALRAGRIAAVPAETIVRETPTSIVIDAGNGLGPPAATRAMTAVIDKARAAGAAFGAVRHANHFGIAGFYAMLALEHDMIGIAATTSPRTSAPTFGTAALIGANPWAYAIPAAREPAFVLDFATTAQGAGETLDRALSGLGGAGTDNGGHKGYGLGLLVDVMCAVLAGGAFGSELPATNGHGGVAHFFGAIRIDGFRDVATFEADMDRELRAFKESRLAPGTPRIYVAGEIEDERERHARANGVPFRAAVRSELEALAREVGIAFEIGDAVRSFGTRRVIVSTIDGPFTGRFVAGTPGDRSVTFLFEEDGGNPREPLVIDREAVVDVAPADGDVAPAR